MNEIKELFSLIYSKNSCTYINAENPECTSALRPRNDCYWTNVGKGCYHKQEDIAKLNDLATKYSLKTKGEVNLEDAVKYFAKEFYGAKATKKDIEYYKKLFFNLR